MAGCVALAVGLALASGPTTADPAPSTDPLIPFSTLLGGSGGEDNCTAALGPDGAIWIAALSFSVDFPGAERPEVEPYTSDIVVLRFDPVDRRVLSHLWIGGEGEPVAIAFDAAGSAFLAGNAYPEYFPTTPGFPIARGSGDFGRDAFLARISPDGRKVEWSGTFGGTDYDLVTGLAVLPEGDPVLVGVTESPNFPVAAPLQPVFGGGYSDGFVIRFRGDGAGVVFSTFLGAGGSDGASSVSVLPAGGLLVTGSAESPVFPAPDVIFGDLVEGWGSVAILDSGGTSVERVAFLGESEIGGCIVEAPNRILLWGRTGASDFPGSFPEGQTYPTFLLRLDPGDWSILNASAADVDGPSHCSRGGNGTIWMAGQDGPIPGAARPFPGLDWDSYAAAFSGDDLGQIYGSFLAGRHADRVGGLVAAADGSAWVVGTSGSPDFPLSDPVQTGPPDGSEWFSMLFVTNLLAGDPATRPADPANLAAESLPDGTVRLTWEDRSSDETGFAVYRHGRDAMEYAWYESDGVDRIAVVPAGSQEWVDATVVSNRYYAWSVQAINDSGGSGTTDVAELDLPPTLAVTVDSGLFRPGRMGRRLNLRLRGALAVTADSPEGSLDPRAGGFEWAIPGSFYSVERHSIPSEDSGWRYVGRRIRWRSRDLWLDFERETGNFDLRLSSTYPGSGREGGPQPMQFTLGRRSGTMMPVWRPAGHVRRDFYPSALRIP